MVKSSIKDDYRIPECENIFEWKIENWNQLSNEKVYYSLFVIGNYKW